VILGKAYTEAQTEYGLILAEKVLETMKKHNSKQQLTEEEIRSIIRKGDRIFTRCSKDNTIDPKEALADKFISILVACDIPHDDAVVMETNFNDDDEVLSLMMYRYLIHTVTHHNV
jgi:predicted transcriptional regulator